MVSAQSQIVHFGALTQIHALRTKKKPEQTKINTSKTTIETYNYLSSHVMIATNIPEVNDVTTRCWVSVATGISFAKPQ